MLKKLFLLLALVFVGIQFFRPARNDSTAPTPADFIARHQPPAEVAQILKNACYDCHSDHTRYPWYAEIQPVGWWLAHHIKEAKAELNFSLFGDYPAGKKGKKLREMHEEVEERHMPLPSYGLMHGKLTETEVKTLTDWVATQREQFPEEK